LRPRPLEPVLSKVRQADLLLIPKMPLDIVLHPALDCLNWVQIRAVRSPGDIWVTMAVHIGLSRLRAMGWRVVLHENDVVTAMIP
jgi:hypothetical protein